MLSRTGWSVASAASAFHLQITQSQSGKGTWSHSSPATGCVGLGNQPDRLATSLAAPMLPWMSLMDDAEIWESGSNPDNMPCSSEHGASEQNNKGGGVMILLKLELLMMLRKTFILYSCYTLVLKSKYTFCISLFLSLPHSRIHVDLCYYAILLIILLVSIWAL